MNPTREHAEQDQRCRETAAENRYWSQREWEVAPVEAMPEPDSAFLAEVADGIAKAHAALALRLKEDADLEATATASGYFNRHSAYHLHSSATES